MGLKNIHLLFISMAIALCLTFGSWSVWMYRDQGHGGYVAVGVVSFASAVALMVYGTWFVRKMKRIHIS